MKKQKSAKGKRYGSRWKTQDEVEGQSLKDRIPDPLPSPYLQEIAVLL